MSSTITIAIVYLHASLARHVVKFINRVPHRTIVSDLLVPRALLLPAVAAVAVRAAAVSVSRVTATTAAVRAIAGVAILSVATTIAFRAAAFVSTGHRVGVFTTAVRKQPLSFLPSSGQPSLTLPLALSALSHTTLAAGAASSIAAAAAITAAIAITTITTAASASIAAIAAVAAITAAAAVAITATACASDTNSAVPDMLTTIAFLSLLSPLSLPVLHIIDSTSSCALINWSRSAC